MKIYLKATLILVAFMCPLYSNADGQDWMMDVDNGIYFFKLIGLYILGIALLFLIFKRGLNKKLSPIFIVIIMISFFLHWQKTKSKKMNGPIEEYLNSKNIDSTKFPNIKSG